MALQAARNLLHALPESIAVVRPDDHALQQQLASTSISIITNPHHHLGINSSLVCGLRACPEAAGWVIALADMPFIPVDIIRQVVQCLRDGAAIAAPHYCGQRGHPVGFSAQWRAELLQLQGDNGARAIVLRHADQLQRIEVSTAQVLIDIDQPADLKNSFEALCDTKM